MRPHDLVFREMAADEITRIAEVNRAETVFSEYRPHGDGSGLGLVARRVDLPEPMEIPPWDDEGVATRATEWRAHLARGGWLYGAFSADRLVGFVIVGPRRADASGEVVALFVDRDHRRKGIASDLMSRAESHAVSHGIRALYLYANPTESSTGFYLDRGFTIAGLISKEVVAGLSGDIVLTKILRSVG